MLVLEHGKPMIFGKDRDKGIRLDGPAPGGRDHRRERRDRGGPARPRREGRGAVPRADAVAHVLAGLPGPGRRPARRSTGRPTTSSSRTRSRRPSPERGGRPRRRRSTAARPGPSSRTDGGADERWICPVCGFENLTGAEVCDNCGADLAGTGIPQPALTFHGRLARRAPRRARRAPAVDGQPGRRRVDVAIAKMHEAEVDCVLVTVDDRLVGIFTDRDAVVKAAGKRLDAFKVRDFMTPDPVVLRHDDPIAIAIHKMAVGGFRHIPIIEAGGRPASSPPATSSTTSRRRSTDRADRHPRRRPDLGDASGRSRPWRGRRGPVAVRSLAALEAAAARRRRRRRRPDRPRLRRDRRADRRGPRGRAVRSSPSASTTTSSCDGELSLRAPSRVHPYRRLFEDGPRQHRRVAGSTAARSARPPATMTR